MELRDIGIFLTPAEELYFGRTAERLHVTPSRVSHAIKKQERRIGAPLFERTSCTVRSLRSASSSGTTCCRPTSGSRRPSTGPRLKRGPAPARCAQAHPHHSPPHRGPDDFEYTETSAGRLARLAAVQSLHQAHAISSWPTSTSGLRGL
ncbi:LysR family transcriptional regulator [Streptomyces sp. NPDC057460]|uniref:helix-turn-helix domain-containing protein n=1 Tax=Streptomyces sp. NPDC057460 TaxID=3346141 RepID=UPI0036A5CA2B